MHYVSHFCSQILHKLKNLWISHEICEFIAIFVNSEWNLWIHNVFCDTNGSQNILIMFTSASHQLHKGFVDSQSLHISFTSASQSIHKKKFKFSYCPSQQIHNRFTTTLSLNIINIIKNKPYILYLFPFFDQNGK